VALGALFNPNVAPHFTPLKIVHTGGGWMNSDKEDKQGYSQGDNHNLCIDIQVVFILLLKVQIILRNLENGDL
jgi:hypothetical protein